MSAEAPCSLVEREAARVAMVAWITPDELAEAARRALGSALARSKRAPDLEDYDPANPAEWYRAELFAEDVADLVRLEVFKLAQTRGVHGLAHHVEQLQRLVDGSEVQP